MVEIAKYPAKSHALRTVANLKLLESRDSVKEQVSSNGLIFFAATKTKYWPHCDQTVPFRQNRYFNYFTGAHDLPEGVVTFDIQSSKLTLYIPPVDDDDVMWSGLPLSIDEALTKYDVDAVKYLTDLESDLKMFSTSSVGASVLSTDESEEFAHVKLSNLLLEAVDEARMIKDEYELDLMRKASEITDNSHLAVMSALPIETNEGHIHAEFVYHAMRQGSKHTAYDPICCSGPNCGTLHYVKNDLPLDNKLLVLIDAGAEWQTYASDVTRVFPINGKWTKESRAIYDAVSDMQDQTMTKVAPGVEWEDLHTLSHRVLIDHFLKLGIFKNGTAEEIFKAGTSVAFYPHGLGHLLGMDTHDCGGRADYDDPNPMLRYLRLRRPLQHNMVVTVEPGIYFNKFLLEPYLSNPEHAKFIDQEVLEKYMPVGGVRIEDDVHVTATGYDNLTKITKDPEEISRIVTEGINKGRKHFHVVV